MKPPGTTVATMEPTVAGYATTRQKLAGAFALGTAILTLFGWLACFVKDIHITDENLRRRRLQA